MQMRGIIPNSLTMANLVCGCLAIYLLFTTDSYMPPAVLILLAAGFDVFDGLTARMLKVDGAIGKQLDSLADAVTFGVAPALMVMHLSRNDLGTDDFEYLVFLPLILAVASVYRLAKFNVGKGDSTLFYGIPTPANALFWIATAVFYEGGYEWSHFVCLETVLPASVLMSWWMVSNVPMLSLKMKGLSLKDNKFLYLLLALSLIAIVISKVFTGTIFPAVLIVLLLYLLISLVSQRSNKSHEVSRRN